MTTPAVYLHLFHGRDNPDQDMQDWGYQGPTLGPFKYVHVTYMGDVKFSMRREEFVTSFPEIAAEWRAKGYSNIAVEWVEHNLNIVDDMIEYRGKFYGDFSITSHPDP